MPQTIEEQLGEALELLSELRDSPMNSKLSERVDRLLNGEESTDASDQILDLMRGGFDDLYHRTGRGSDVTTRAQEVLVRGELVLNLVRKIAAAETWDEAENGMGADGSITREFQEGREEEAQDWIMAARELLEEVE